MEIVLSIDGTGTVQGLYHDSFNPGFLGAQRVVRQTDILFHEPSQSWAIEYLRDGAPSPCNSDALRGFGTYEEARGFEVRWLNTCRFMGITDPAAPDGLRVAESLRS
jgi:hypothetical protein